MKLYIYVIDVIRLKGSRKNNIMKTSEPKKTTLLCEKIKELEGRVQITIDGSIYDFQYNLIHDIDYEYSLIVVDEQMAKVYGISCKQSVYLRFCKLSQRLDKVWKWFLWRVK